MAELAWKSLLQWQKHLTTVDFCPKLPCYGIVGESLYVVIELLLVVLGSENSLRNVKDYNVIPVSSP